MESARRGKAATTTRVATISPFRGIPALPTSGTPDPAIDRHQAAEERYSHEHEWGDILQYPEKPQDVEVDPGRPRRPAAPVTQAQGERGEEHGGDGVCSAHIRNSRLGPSRLEGGTPAG